MLTARAGEDDKVVGLESGVDDYVTKPFSPRELEARIQAVLRRRRPQVSKEAIEIEGLVLNPATRNVTGGRKTLRMGPTEFELLHFFMTHPDRVYGRAQILDQVWGDHVFLEDRTVDVHIRRLREALSPSGHDKLVETVRGAGYRFRSAY
jgi:two-component system phosphate regulon response regulator PhoB